MRLVNVHIHKLLSLFLISGMYAANAQTWTLNQCIDTAQVHNKSLQMSRNNVAASEQRIKEAKANLIPKLTANADYKYFTNLPYQLMPLSTFNPAAPEGQFREAQFGVPHNISANLQLSVPLYNPQAHGAIGVTKIAAELTALRVLKTEEEIYFEIASLYYNAQILHHQADFIANNLKNAERLLETISLLNEQLLAKGTDVNKVKLQVAQLNTQQKMISAKYQQVINALKLAMGISSDRDVQIETAIQYGQSIAYTPVSTVDIRLSEAGTRMLSAELSILNKTSFFPSLNLIGMYGASGFGYDKQPNDFLRFYPIGFAGVQLSYPLFNGTVTRRKINQKQHELHNSFLQAGLLTEQNNMKARNAEMQREVARSAVLTTEEQIRLAGNIYEQTLLQQEHGTAGVTEILLADNALRESQQNYLSSVIDYLRADLELKKVTGNISTSKR